MKSSFGTKGIKLHRLIQDRRQVCHDTALADAHGLKIHSLLGQEDRHDLKKN
jgi:hypothetical protein